MRVPSNLSTSFGVPFQELIAGFATEQGLMPSPEVLDSPRFLARSIIPHVRRLSAMFNRQLGETKPTPDEEPDSSLDEAYWKKSSNPEHFRLAYFLYFMPSNLYRVAAVWSELARLGYRWPQSASKLRAIEFGAGPAAGACGIAAGEKECSLGLPKEGNWALIEQDKAMLQLGEKWASTYFADRGHTSWETRTFHRKIDFARGMLPPSAPRFNLWVMSYFLNESSLPPAELARILVEGWEKHLDEEGLVIMVEPALRTQSRKLLEIRKEILAIREKRGLEWLQILLPCLGHQACGALADAEDWCHEDVSWWRPPYFKKIDQMASLDRKSLPFSYLVITKSMRPRNEILSSLSGFESSNFNRLVSPAHPEGREQEFFICGQDGKRRARYRATNQANEENHPSSELQRGDILVNAVLRGDVRSTRIEKITDVK